MRRRARYVGRALLALALSAAAFATPSSGADGDKGGVTTRRIGAGAYYKRISKPKKKWLIHVITVKLAKASAIDVGLAGDQLGYTETLSSLASRRGAIAGINGDFGTRSKRPWNLYAQDGRLIQTERSWGRVLTVSSNEKSVFLGHPHLTARLVPAGGKRIRIRVVNNGRPGRRQVALFTRAGDEVENTPEHACAARLIPRGKVRVNEHGVTSRPYKVDAARCASRRMPLRRGAVVAARRSGSQAEEIKALVPGQLVSLKWSLPIEGTMDAIGGNPMIVQNGRVLKDVVTDCGYLCNLHPRSGVGITKDNKILFVVVDGRSETARGMYLHEFARFFVAQGAKRAMTFDGGGAAEMWIRGEVVNTPSDGRERPLVNALLLLPRAQRTNSTSVQPYGSPSLARYSTSSPAVTAQAFEDAAADPGSLGGLADFLDRRGEPIPPEMKQIAESLRAGKR